MYLCINVPALKTHCLTWKVQEQKSIHNDCWKNQTFNELHHLPSSAPPPPPGSAWACAVTECTASHTRPPAPTRTPAVWQTTTGSAVWPPPPSSSSTVSEEIRELVRMNPWFPLGIKGYRLQQSPVEWNAMVTWFLDIFLCGVVILRLNEVFLVVL